MKLHALVVGLTFAASLTGALAGMPSLSDVRAALSRAHFSYLMNRDEVTLRRIGEIKTDHRRYCIVYYVWEESWRHAHERGGFPHAAHRLLVFDRTANSLQYLGLYNVSVAPVAIRGNKILFDADPEFGNEIVFGRDGPPREASPIDGEIPDFDTKP